MKTRFGSAVTMTAAAILFMGAASTAEACDAGRGGAATNSLYQKTKRRMPLAAFMAKIKINQSGKITSADADAPATAVEPSIAGLWSTAFVEGDQAVDAGFEMFNTGGTHVLNDPSPILEGNVCLGAYTQIAPYTYVVNHPSYLYDDAGVQVIGIVAIYEKIVLDPSGDSFTEQAKVIVTDLDGNVLNTIEGQAVGKRVKADNAPFQ
jgi:hypothetical protein